MRYEAINCEMLVVETNYGNEIVSLGSVRPLSDTIMAKLGAGCELSIGLKTILEPFVSGEPYAARIVKGWWSRVDELHGSGLKPVSQFAGAHWHGPFETESQALNDVKEVNDA